MKEKKIQPVPTEHVIIPTQPIFYASHNILVDFGLKKNSKKICAIFVLICQYDWTLLFQDKTWLSILKNAIVSNNRAKKPYTPVITLNSYFKDKMPVKVTKHEIK
jgi:hypothetical protein